MNRIEDVQENWEIIRRRNPKSIEETINLAWLSLLGIGREVEEEGTVRFVFVYFLFFF